MSNGEKQPHTAPDSMSTSSTSGHSVTLTSDSQECGCAVGHRSGRGDSTWLVTPPACFTLGSSAPSDSNPLEDLLIEHPSMSVYGGRTTTAARGRPGNHTQPTSQQVAPAASRPTVRACLATRSEPYLLRKSTMQKSKASKKLNSKKAFQRQNHTSHVMQKNHNRHTAMRPAVFQPRK